MRQIIVEGNSNFTAHASRSLSLHNSCILIAENFRDLYTNIQTPPLLKDPLQKLAPRL